MVAALREALNERLPPNYVAEGDQYVCLVDARRGIPERFGKKPDVFVQEVQPTRGVAVQTLELGAPAEVALAVRRLRQRFLRIRHYPSQRVVTVLELLSPKNKTGPGRQAYLAKRRRYLASGVNLVELDLLRVGSRMPVVRPGPPRSPYLLLVVPAWARQRAGAWPLPLREPLPELPIPLTPRDPLVRIPMRACVDRVYDGGRYPAKLDYTRPLDPPLAEADAAWARDLLARRTA
jgi:hypothetical protein